MKKYLIIMLSVFLIFSGAILAQEQVNKPVNVIEKKAEKMAKELGLTDVEKANVKALLEKQSAEVKKLKAELSPGENDFKVKMKELHKTQEVELKNIIGKEKYAKMKVNRAAEKARMEAAKAKM
jgi:acylphosphatase